MRIISWLATSCVVFILQEGQAAAADPISDSENAALVTGNGQKDNIVPVDSFARREINPRFQTEIYPVEDLLQAAKLPQSAPLPARALMDLVHDAVKTDWWNPQGRRGTLKFDAAQNSLVVYQTAANQQVIRELLEEMRKGLGPQIRLDLLIVELPSAKCNQLENLSFGDLGERSSNPNFLYLSSYLQFIVAPPYLCSYQRSSGATEIERHLIRREIWSGQAVDTLLEEQPGAGTVVFAKATLTDDGRHVAIKLVASRPGDPATELQIREKVLGNGEFLCMSLPENPNLPLFEKFAPPGHEGSVHARRKSLFIVAVPQVIHTTPHVPYANPRVPDWTVNSFAPECDPIAYPENWEELKLKTKSRDLAKRAIETIP